MTLVLPSISILGKQSRYPYGKLTSQMNHIDLVYFWLGDPTSMNKMEKEIEGDSQHKSQFFTCCQTHVHMSWHKHVPPQMKMSYGHMGNSKMKKILPYWLEFDFLSLQPSYVLFSCFLNCTTDAAVLNVWLFVLFLSFLCSHWKAGKSCIFWSSM